MFNLNPISRSIGLEQFPKYMFFLTKSLGPISFSRPHDAMALGKSKSKIFFFFAANNAQNGIASAH